MEKTEYLSKKSEIDNKFNELRNELNDLQELYIQCNKQFNIGERIQIFTPETTWQTFGSEKTETKPEKIRFAYFEKYKIDYSGNIEIICYKEKKDGTPSKIRDYVSKRETVSKTN